MIEISPTLVEIITDFLANAARNNIKIETIALSPDDFEKCAFSTTLKSFNVIGPYNNCQIIKGGL
jgi:hypothetical protein